MRRIIVFDQVTLDGYFTDNSGDMSWAHKNDPEWNAFVEGNAGTGGTLLFGRVTYQMMASFWPTPAAKQALPAVAKEMNRTPKIVISRTLDQATWSNTTILKDLTAIPALKKDPGPDIVILGSGTIVAQLAEQGWIDEYQLVVNPLVIGTGRTLFEDVRNKVALKLKSTRSFTNGNVLLTYEPA
jgi:dihydrofolate reductase